MNNYVQDGDVLTVDPGATVAAGTGIMIGTALFGVAVVDGVSGTASAVRVRGVVEIAKTSALAISVGDVLYWSAGTSMVNKTSASQRVVGVAVEAAANPSATVKMLLGVHTGPALS
jgi:predicted RecA/RadA family phage recombinase